MTVIENLHGDYVWLETPPRYGLHKSGEVLLYTGEAAPENEWGWGIPCERTETIAHVTSREAGLAVLRLFGVAEFYDFQRGKDWSDWEKMKLVADG